MTAEYYKEKLDKMLIKKFREMEDKTQVFKIEFPYCGEDIEEVKKLKKLYMKTNKSPYIFDIEEFMFMIKVYYIPYMKFLGDIEDLLEKYPEIETEEDILEAEIDILEIEEDL